MTLRRWFALCGVAAPVLVALAYFAVGGTTPNDKASAAKVVSFYRDHKNASVVTALMIAVAAVLLALFAARLRETLRGDGADGSLLPIAAFGGALIFAVGLLLGAQLHFALIQAADHRFETPAQTLNVLNQNDFLVMAGGSAVLMLAAGLATVRRPVLPRWLGWTAIVIGVLSLPGPLGPIGFFLALLWILVAAILMVVRTDLIAAGAG